MARDEAYHRAEEKIEAVRLTGAVSLDLVNMDLSELPEALGQFTQLQELNLSRNRLTALPEWLGQLAQLQELDLSYNWLTALPEWLGQLTQLWKLDLSNNRLATLPENLGQLTFLKLLYLFGNELTELPDSLGQLELLSLLALYNNRLTALPETLGQLTQLQELVLSGNSLKELPEALGDITNLTRLFLNRNPISTVPAFIRRLRKLQKLDLISCPLERLPEWIGELRRLGRINLANTQISDLPANLVQLKHLYQLDLDYCPLNPELAAAYAQGLDAVKAYLRAKAAAQMQLYEAKLILVGEGEVGKSCLLGALRGDPWEEYHPTTHGIEIKPVEVADPTSGRVITLNGWDFGGQRVYRPTHQFFFSAPAVYLVVWKPREGPQQGFVKEWIRLIRHRAPEAKILVVATHGGPGQRQPDIDRQDLRDLFGEDTLLGFFHVESKPDEYNARRGIPELKEAIARVAASLPEMGRGVPKRWQEIRQALEDSGAAYLPLGRVLALCRQQGMDDEEASLFIAVSHRLGRLIHYQHDPLLRDIVVLRPDWLATAISLVLDDEATRRAHGLVSFSHLCQLWADPSHPLGKRYPAALQPVFPHLKERLNMRYPVELYPIFLRLMERFDLSYRVAGLSPRDDSDPVSLVAQLVPDNRPNLSSVWPPEAAPGEAQQTQICRIVNLSGESAAAEGLFYQLIVRLHRYSLGRLHYDNSVHWQRGLLLDNDYNGHALLEHRGNDVHITVRAAYPEGLLTMLTSEVKYLVESFWEGLRCQVMVPCIAPCGRNAPGTGLFEVQKLIESKRKNRRDYPCPVCDDWHAIDSLLRNAPAARPLAPGTLFAGQVLQELERIRKQVSAFQEITVGRFDRLDASDQRILSQVDAAYAGLMQTFTDEAKDGPRLFSVVPAERKLFDPRRWTKARFRLTLWCEHSRLPLPVLNGKDSQAGVYDLELARDWFKKAAPFLRVLTGMLSLVLPVASAGVKLALDEVSYKAIEEQLDFGKEAIDAALEGSEKIEDWLGEGNPGELPRGAGKLGDLPHGEALRAHGATLRELHALLKAKDPGFGELVRVMNKRQEYLWVHPYFESEY